MGWTVRGSNTGGGRDSQHPFRAALGPAQPPIQCRVIPGVKLPGRGAYHPSQSSAEVKERIELYLYCNSGSSWPLFGVTLPLP